MKRKRKKKVMKRKNNNIKREGHRHVLLLYLNFQTVLPLLNGIICSSQSSDHNG